MKLEDELSRALKHPVSAVSSGSSVRAVEVAEPAWRDPPGEGGMGGEGHIPSPQSFAGEPGRCDCAPPEPGQRI